MTMHTEGPWKVGQYLGSLRQFAIHMDVGDRGRGSDVAFTSAAFGNDETIANARLIAAAPDLLKALQELCEIVQDAIEQKSAKDLDSFTLQPARAAIARATGEQQ